MAKMQNVRCVVENEILTIQVDLRETAHEAKSGMSMLVADTHGFKALLENGEERDEELTLMVRRPFREDER